MTKLFRPDNTEGYTQQQLDQFNAEWERHVSDLGLEDGTDEFYDAAKQFCTEVAARG